MPASHANSAMTNVPLRTSGCGWTAPWKKPTIAVGRHARPRRETSGAASRRAHPSHHCWPTCFSLTAGSRYGLGPNVYPRKSNSPSGTLQIRVFSSFTVSFKEGHGESRSDHSGLRRDPVSLRDNGSFPDLRPILQTEEARARQNENSLESAIARIERRMALGEDRTARAFETIAHMLDRPPGSRVTLFTETGRSTVEDAVSRVATQPFEAHVANAVPGSEEKTQTSRRCANRSPQWREFLMTLRRATRLSPSKALFEI